MLREERDMNLAGSKDLVGNTKTSPETKDRLSWCVVSMNILSFHPELASQ